MDLMPGDYVTLAVLPHLGGTSGDGRVGVAFDAVQVDDLARCCAEKG